MRFFCLQFLIYLAAITSIVCKTNNLLAQITPDSTLPDNSSFQEQGNRIIIQGGTQAESNLFHSFQEFGVPKDAEAFFDNTVEVQNIITRVTGKSISEINGLISTKNAANLFLINPNGIVFGENARLDIGGSFLGTTADSLLFENGLEFSTINPTSKPLLSINVPLGLQFGKNPQDIRLEGLGAKNALEQGLGLKVDSGKTLALVGGNVIINGVLINAPQGQIELGSVAGTAQVNLNSLNQGWNFNYQNIEQFGNIEINRSLIDISVRENNNVDKSNVNSAISIRSAQLDIGTSSIVNGNTFTAVSGPDVNINVERLIMQEGATISTRTLETGEGGNLNVNATEFVKLIGTTAGGFSPTSLSSSSFASGKAGSLTINTNELIIRDGASISAGTIFGDGDAGKLTVNSNKIQVIGSSTGPSELTATAGRGSSGNGGQLVIKTGELLVADGATVAANTFGKGEGGDLTIDTEKLRVENGGTVSAGTFRDGNGGNLTITADKIEVIGRISDIGTPSALFTSAQVDSIGDAGNLTINSQQVRVSEGAGIFVNSLTGTAGNLTINARSINLDNQGLLSANTRSAEINPEKEQATININSRDLILRRQSNITTNARGENVIGGNINIDSDILAAFENSDISANSANFRGGNVIINSKGIFGTQFRDALTFQSDITATGANPDLSGNVELNAPENQIEEQPQLPADIRKAEFDQRCSSDGKVAQNSFTIPGRGGLPPSPHQILNSSAPWEDWRTIENNNSLVEKTSISNNQPDKKLHRIVEAKGWIIDKDGTLVFTASPVNMVASSNSLNTIKCQ